jgi:hypothetical protein
MSELPELPPVGHRRRSIWSLVKASMASICWRCKKKTGFWEKGCHSLPLPGLIAPAEEQLKAATRSSICLQSSGTYVLAIGPPSRRPKELRRSIHPCRGIKPKDSSSFAKDLCDRISLSLFYSRRYCIKQIASGHSY